MAENNLPARLIPIVDSLFERQLISVPIIAELTGTSYPTAKTDLKKLQTCGVLHDKGRDFGGTTFYMALEIMTFAYDLE